MTREVIWEFGAIEALLDLSRRDRAQAARILRAIEQFADRGRGDFKKLSASSGQWRLRVGDWRIFYVPRPEANAIHLLAIRLRRDAYE